MPACNIDTHRHLGGSIPVSFVWEAIKRRRLRHLAESLEEVQAAMTFTAGESPGFHRFLDKFKILDHIPWDEDLIWDSIRATCDEFKRENLDCIWLRFSINKYMDHMTWHRTDAIRFVADAFAHHLPGKVAMLLSLKYESARASQRQMAELLENPDVAKRLAGLDLVGDEAYFDADFYAGIFKLWHGAGKILCAHVAESCEANNAALAITRLRVNQIAHGIKITTNKDLMQMALDYDVGFDLALTSNFLTGVCEPQARHPIDAMLRFGLDCTIGTDDPVQCQTTLEREREVLAAVTDTATDAINRTAKAALKRSRRYGLIP